jgi:hypothetical protein
MIQAQESGDRILPLIASRHSNLTCVPCQEPGRPIQIDQLRRVRKPVSRSKSGVQGKVADVIHGRSRHAESQNELKAFQILVATAHAESWQEQPFTLAYHHEGAKHRYTPDLLVSWGVRQDVVEIKDDHEAALPENQARFALISALLAGRGYHFRLWRRSEIWAEPRLTNANLILRYRRVPVSPPDRERVRRAFASTPACTLGTLCAISKTAVPSMLRLVMEGALHIDWWEPLSLDSHVGVTPVGRQTWPCLPAGMAPTPREDVRCH